MSKDKVFLFCLITNDRFYENVCKFWYWINNLAYSPENEKDVICLVLNFLKTVTLAHAFLLEVNFKVFDKSPRQASQLRDIPDQEFYFLLTCGQLCFRDYVNVSLAMEFYNLTSSFGCHPRIIASWLERITLKSEVSALVNCLRVFKVVWSLWLHNNFERAWHNKIEPFSNVALLVQKISFFQILRLVRNHKLRKWVIKVLNLPKQTSFRCNYRSIVDTICCP